MGVPPRRRCLILTVLPLLGALRRTPARRGPSSWPRCRPAAGRGDGADGARPRGPVEQPSARRALGRTPRARSAAPAAPRPAPPAWPPTPRPSPARCRARSSGDERLLVGVGDAGEALDLARRGRARRGPSRRAARTPRPTPARRPRRSACPCARGPRRAAPRKGDTAATNVITPLRVSRSDTQARRCTFCVAVLAREAEVRRRGSGARRRRRAPPRGGRGRAAARPRAGRSSTCPSPTGRSARCRARPSPRAGAASVPYAIGPRFGSRPCRSKARKLAEQPVVGPVVVRRPGGQQAELRAAVRQQPHLLLGVGGVEGLHPVEPGGAVAVDRGQHRVARPGCPRTGAPRPPRRPPRGSSRSPPRTVGWVRAT